MTGNQTGFVPPPFAMNERVPAVHHACGGSKREG
jgi:hypothetical protein